MDDVDSFISCDDDEEGHGDTDDEERRWQRREQRRLKKEWRKALGSRLVGSIRNVQMYATCSKGLSNHAHNHLFLALRNARPYYRSSLAFR
jgi:hypothetical protein